MYHVERTLATWWLPFEVICAPARYALSDFAAFGSAHKQRSYMKNQKDLSRLGYGLLGGRAFGAGGLQSFSSPSNVM